MRPVRIALLDRRKASICEHYEPFEYFVHWSSSPAFQVIPITIWLCHLISFAHVSNTHCLHRSTGGSKVNFVRNGAIVSVAIIRNFNQVTRSMMNWKLIDAGFKSPCSFCLPSSYSPLLASNSTRDSYTAPVIAQSKAVCAIWLISSIITLHLRSNSQLH